MAHLYGLESMISIGLVERDRVLEEVGGHPEVLDGDGDGDGPGHAGRLQVDVLQAVRPKQVRSQQGEPKGHQHEEGMLRSRIWAQRGNFRVNSGFLGTTTVAHFFPG